MTKIAYLANEKDILNKWGKKCYEKFPNEENERKSK